MTSDLLRKWAESADILIAADSGADRLLAVGSTPRHVVGDFDSLSEQALQCGADLYKSNDQNSTDCDKLLRFAAEQELFPITLAGVEGDRLDHVFGTVHSVALSEIRKDVTMAVRRGLSWVLGPGLHHKDVPEGRRVSLIPLITTTGVSTTGLEWRLDKATLEAGMLTSISNLSTQTGIEVQVASGILLLVAEFFDEEFPLW